MNETKLDQLLEDISVPELDQLFDEFIENLPSHVTPAFEKNYEILTQLGWLTIRIACRNGNHILVDKMINDAEYDPYPHDVMLRLQHWDSGLQGACHGGHLALAHRLIKLGAIDFDSGLRAACRGGHDDLVDLMIEMGTTGWNAGFVGACRGGHLALAHRMLENDVRSWNWSSALMDACRGGHRALVDLVIEKSLGFHCSKPRVELYPPSVMGQPWKEKLHWDYGLAGACRGGHDDLVDLMIEMGATTFNWGLAQASIDGHRALMELMIEKGATNCWGEFCHLCLDCLTS